MTGKTKLTMAVQRKVCASLRVGVSYKVAAASAGIVYESLRAWRARGRDAIKEAGGDINAVPDADKPHAAFAVALEKAEAQAIEARVKRIANAGKEGYWQADAWWLERVHPEQFARTQRTEITGQNGGPVQVAGTLAGAIDAALAATPEIKLDTDDE